MDKKKLAIVVLFIIAVLVTSVAVGILVSDSKYESIKPVPGKDAGKLNVVVEGNPSYFPSDYNE